MLILDGRVVRDEKIKKLKREVEKLPVSPTLAILQVGDLPGSNAYIGRKKDFAKKTGIEVRHLNFTATVAASALLEEIEQLNNDTGVNGIIVQLPIPPDLPKEKIINTIAPPKDVDGLTAANKTLFEKDDPKGIVPATARGVLSLLSYYKIPVAGKRVTVLGRSALVGGPIAALLRNRGANVTVCHRGTENVPEKTRAADIVIVAIGAPRFITRDYLSPGQVVVDVGINSVLGEKLEEEIPRRKVVGDVDFEAVKTVVHAISPVPGGVGPMTVASLFENVVEVCERQLGKML